MENETGLLATIISTILAAIPGLLIGAFAWFKAKAASDGVQNWKDDLVSVVESTATEVVNRKNAE